MWLGSHTANRQSSVLQQIPCSSKMLPSIKMQQPSHWSRPRVGHHSSYVFCQCGFKINSPLNHSSFLALLTGIPLGVHTCDCVSIHVHMCECICTYMCACKYVHVSVYMCMPVCEHICVCACVNISMYMCLWVWTDICMNIWEDACVHLYVNCICIYAERSVSQSWDSLFWCRLLWTVLWHTALG